MKKLLLPVASFLLALSAFSVAYASPILMLTNFHLHDFDPLIAKAIGFDSTSVIYFSEMGSLTDAESAVRKKYETVGCYPFYVMKEGKIQEVGYNCGSFFCVGFQQGPKQCRDTTGASYGGIVEINRRLGIMTLNDEQKPFASFPADQQTQEMKNRIATLATVGCTPFYLMRFDMAVGEGYTCAEIGKYPDYSAKNTCINDWRTNNGIQCDVPIRPNEMDLRQRAVNRARGTMPVPESTGTTVLSNATTESGSTVTSSESSASSAASLFPDVLPGKYGYTAITSLAAAGIITGYPDGTFKPQNPVSRAEFTTLLGRLMLPAISSGATVAQSHCFKDVSTEWFAPAVCSAKGAGWVKGYGDGTFRPLLTVKRAEAIKIVVAALGLPSSDATPLPTTVSASMWYGPYVRTAIANGLLLEPTFLPDTPSTRADAAVWLYRAMKAQETSSTH
jgi:hypothetical protein